MMTDSPENINIAKKHCIIIAIDGPVGSGKGTIARMLAQRFGLKYIDSGLFYRKVAAISIYGDSSADLQNDALEKNFPESVLRSEEISAKASGIAELQHIRSLVMELIRRCVRDLGDNVNGVVMDGRDIGTVVFPNATCKIYLTASAEIRAKRRLDDVNRNGQAFSYEEIYKSILERDTRDSSRDLAPLTIEDDYEIIDTSDETPEESCSRIEKIVKTKLQNLQS
jgi:cytidylate kinase